MTFGRPSEDDPLKAQEKNELALSPKNSVIVGKLLWLLVDEFELSISDLEVLLDVNGRSLYDAKDARRLPTPCNDRYRRVGHLLGIKKNLEIIFPRNEEVRKNWLKVPREVFKGKSAIEMIKENPLDSMSRLFTVRRLLEMFRNGSINELT